MQIIGDLYTQGEQSTKDINTTNNLTKQILWAILFGTLCGLLIKFSPVTWRLGEIFADGIFNIGGAVFINLVKLLVVPLVFFSLLSGICNLRDVKKLGTIGIKSIAYFVTTTAFATLLAVLIANALHVGKGASFPIVSSVHEAIPSLQQFLINIVPSNPFQALAEANILQIIVFTVILGTAINMAGDAGKRIASLLNDLNFVIMKTIMLVMRFTPIGVFCLIAILFAKLGLEMIAQLVNYFIVVVAVLFIHTIIVYGFMLKFLAKLNPVKFFKKMYSVILFSFSVSSSNASLLLALDTVENKLGVNNAVASFVLSLGINMNKNGSAIMQGVAAIFIAHAYHVDIGFVGNVMIVLLTTLGAISTAGVPSVGILSLVMVLKQVGLPVEGIAVILAVDRVLDMLRTSVNVVGNAVIACIVGKNEQKIDLKTYDA